MLALDWDVFLNNMKTTTLLEAGIKDMRNYSIAQLLHDLSLGSTRTAYENFPADCFNKEKSHNISDYVDDLKRYGIVKDVIGILKFYYGTKIYFPTFVSQTLRMYLISYTEVAKRLAEYEGFQVVIWLEDRLSAVTNKWLSKTIEESTAIYRDYFIKEIPTCKIMVSSKISPGIPVDFANTHLSKVNGNDLFSILRYELRNPSNARVLDVVHFAWMCYLTNKCSGIHFAGINNKRHYQIFRQVAGKKMTALLFKLGPEETMNPLEKTPH